MKDYYDIFYIASIMNVSGHILRKAIELYDNRLSLYAAQKGKCAITSTPLTEISNIRCYPRSEADEGRRDRYNNLLLVCKNIYELLIAQGACEVRAALQNARLDKEELAKVNRLREDANKEIIMMT